MTDIVDMAKRGCGSNTCRRHRPKRVGVNGPRRCLEYEVRQLVINRRKECGVGLCGSYSSISKWLLKEHKVFTTNSWVAGVIRDHDKQLTTEDK